MTEMPGARLIPPAADAVGGRQRAPASAIAAVKAATTASTRVRVPTSSRDGNRVGDPELAVPAYDNADMI
ncbi:hypothetical protein Mkiyose1665_59140 [Mycobacterium kiyosense]|uniref:Uncharacterized protein n=1 Tax=Mycobacterium kiyosense TaxID=2871094 RepID=A0A9P3QA92_9MYCO|nr:hypothetical protein IWGMT90018_16120 [Mycobacterium kiyosense]BDE12958.1 hypothetical protein MKCMC460_18180 [Mycobacterium sp. 20KCMC460]GLB83605.1 hypothetical protein SRL2020028_28610 [Mycobacterium kiyosense]GLB93085.1 hypothetical protein SRL2020130_59020 [Mycobacterium kiyosense]GLB99254.1 hypothetical protein SRL2020226_60300 [Mycobacterium kiyosense]